jgi:hypothetical protein
MRLQARWVNPAQHDPALMLGESQFIASADFADGAAANAWLVELAAQHAADCPPGWVPVVCMAGSPWYDPNAD